MQIHRLAVSPIDGTFLGTGHLHRQQGAVTGPQGMLVRLLADGSLHPSFGDSGLIYTPKGQGVEGQLKW